MAFMLEDQFSKTASDIEKSMKGLEGYTEELEANVSAAMNRMAVGAGLMGAGAVVLAPYLASLEKASDLNESLTKAQTVFGESFRQIDAFVNNQAAALGLSNAAALEATGTYGNLFTALGLGKDVAAGYSVELTKLGADLASFNNAKIEDTLGALRSAMTGEMESMKKFGVSINEEMIKNKAVALGLTDTVKGSLDPAIKMQAVYALIMEQTKTAQGDFIRTGDGYANVQRKLAASVDNMQAKLGTVLMPLVLTLSRGLQSIINGLTAFANSPLGAGVLKLVAVLGLLAVSLGAVMLVSGGARFAVFKLAEVFPMATRAALVQSMANASTASSFGMLASAAWAAISPMLPFIAIGVAVAAAAYGIYWMVTRASESFNTLNTATSDTSTGFWGFMQRLGGFLTVIREVWATWDGLTFTLTEGTEQRLKALGIYETALAVATWVVRIKEFFGGVASGISAAASTVWGVVSSVWNRISNAVSGVFEYLGINIGKNTSDLEKWATVGKYTGYVLVGVLGAIGAAMLVVAVNSVIAFAPVILAIGAVVAVGWVLWKMFQGIAFVVKFLWDAIKPLRDILGALFSLIASVVGGVLSVFWNILKAIGTVLSDVVIWYFERWYAIMSAVVGVITWLASTIWDILVPVFQAIGQIISTYVVPVFSFLGEVISELADNITWAFQKAYDMIMKLLNGAKEAWGFLQGMGASLGNGISGAYDGLKNDFDQLGTSIDGTVNYLFGNAPEAQAAAVGGQPQGITRFAAENTGRAQAAQAQMARPQQQQNQQPIVVHTNLTLDGRVVAETVNEHNELSNARK